MDEALAIVHGLPDARVGICLHRAPVVADARVQQGTHGITTPIVHLLQRQARANPLCAMQATGKQGPSLWAVTALGYIPIARTLCTFAPITPLKARIRLANVVQKGQCRQALDIRNLKWPACCGLQRAAHAAYVTSGSKHACNVDLVIDQRMDLQWLPRLLVEFAPCDPWGRHIGQFIGFVVSHVLVRMALETGRTHCNPHGYRVAVFFRAPGGRIRVDASTPSVKPDPS